MLSKSFDFVTSLSPDECEQRLLQLNTSANPDPSREVFEVTIAPNAAYAFDFQMNYSRRGRRNSVLLGQTHGSITPIDAQQSRVSGRTELNKSILYQLGGMALLFLFAAVFARIPILGMVGLLVLAINAIPIYRSFSHANDVISTVLDRS